VFSGWRLWVPKTSSAGRIDAKKAGERLSLSKAPRWHQEPVWTDRRTFGAGSFTHVTACLLAESPQATR
jgi:hypothetical protein